MFFTKEQLGIDIILPGPSAKFHEMLRQRLDAIGVLALSLTVGISVSIGYFMLFRSLLIASAAGRITLDSVYRATRFRFSRSNSAESLR